jgi:hypothetical protein
MSHPSPAKYTKQLSLYPVDGGSDDGHAPQQQALSQPWCKNLHTAKPPLVLLLFAAQSSASDSSWGRLWMIWPENRTGSPADFFAP